MTGFPLLRKWKLRVRVGPVGVKARVRIGLRLSLGDSKSFIADCQQRIARDPQLVASYRYTTKKFLANTWKKLQGRSGCRWGPGGCSWWTDGGERLAAIRAEPVTWNMSAGQWDISDWRSTEVRCTIIQTMVHYLADLITPSAAVSARAGLRSASSGSVAVLRTTPSLGDHSFTVAAPSAWNKLLSPLRRVDSVTFSNTNWKHFSLLRLFQLHFVRRPCCVRAT